MAKKSEKQNQEQQPVIMHEGLKSLRLEVENFKNIKSTVIDIGGRSLIFFGPNGSGKSTLIQAMMSPMNSKLLPSEPVMKGEQRAKISHTIGGNLHGEYQEYIMDFYFTEKDSKGRLVITNKDGEAVKSPATLIKNIIGNVSFDVTKWLNDEKAKKLETIKKLTGSGIEIDNITNQMKAAKEALKRDKDRADDLEAILKNHGYTREQIDAFSTPVDIKPLQEKASAVATSQQTWDGVKNKVDQFKRDVENCGKNINLAAAEINKLQSLINQKKIEIEENTKLADVANQNIVKGQQWLSQTQRPSIEDVNEEINAAIAHNEKCNNVSRLAEQQREMLKLHESVQKTKEAIALLESKRQAIISNSQLPIEGLTFSEDDLLLDGVPLEEGQINTARLFDVGVEVAMALNPNLKIIFLHDGSLFDKEHLHAIVEKIEKKGYMAVIEQVSFEGGELEVKFTEQALK